MDSKQTKGMPEHSPITIPLAALIPTQNLGGLTTPTTTPGSGLAEYVGWQMLQDDLKH